ncbi:MAG: helix-turn-helix transcriptional regulator [Oscillospiraceae bacterium]|nr:helix-turn-helix transcriptional regulator [Oscillospiraceae bacterium]
MKAQAPKQQMRSAGAVALRDIHAVGKRIRFYRERKKLEQKDIAGRLGITPNAVSNWENGRTRPDLSVLPQLCGILGITLYELYGLEAPDAGYTEKEQQLLADYRALSGGHQLAVDRLIESLNAAEQAAKCPDITVLTLCSKQLAAGFDGGAEFDDAGEPVYLYTSALTRQADLVFPVSGNSMEPQYHDGDLVLVQRYPGCPALQYGETGAFIIGNSTYIKVYEKDGLHSLNKRYKTMTFSEDDSVYLIGRVLGILDPDTDFAQPEEIQMYQQLRAAEV